MFKFLKSATLNGLLILLPILFLIIVIKELLELLIGLATPIADLFPPRDHRQYSGSQYSGSAINIR